MIRNNNNNFNNNYNNNFNRNNNYYNKNNNQKQFNKPNPYKQKLERIRFRIDKANVVGESQFSILYKINEADRVWISKKIVFGSEYTNWLNVSPAISSTFKIIGADNQELEISAEKLKELIAIPGETNNEQ